MNYKLKAYTLFDVIIAMVIMGMISAITYVILSSLFVQYNAFDETNKKISSLVLFKNNFKRELFLSKKILSVNNGIIIEMNDSIEIEYKFNPNFIERKFEQQKDTFWLKVDGLKKEYDSGNNVKMVNQINFDLTIFEEEFNLEFSKDYGAYNDINNFFLDEN